MLTKSEQKFNVYVVLILRDLVKHQTFQIKKLAIETIHTFRFNIKSSPLNL